MWALNSKVTHDPGSAMDLLATKILTMSILGLVSLLTGFIPMLVAKKVNLAQGSRGGTIVSCLSCFGGGVILTTVFTHMLPEVRLVPNNHKYQIICIALNKQKRKITGVVGCW